MIKLVLLRGEAKQVLALVSDPVPRTFGPEPRQVPFKGPQCLLPQISLLLYGHDSVPARRSPPIRMEHRHPYSTNSLTPIICPARIHVVGKVARTTVPFLVDETKVESAIFNVIEPIPISGLFRDFKEPGIEQGHEANRVPGFRGHHS